MYITLVHAGCYHTSKTSVTAALWGCDYATNAGFFATQVLTRGCCVGNLIVSGSIVQVSVINTVSLSCQVQEEPPMKDYLNIEHHI